MDIKTLLLHVGDDVNKTAAVVSPIWQTSTYKSPDVPEDFARVAGSVNPPEFYSRHGNPTNEQVQQILAALEKSEKCLVTSSGMGAISAAVLSHLKSGDHVVTQSSLYAAAIMLFREHLPKFGVSTTFVDQTNLAVIEQAVQPNTKLIYVETPSNPSLKLTDLAAVAALAKRLNALRNAEHQILTMCDNTFASPINQVPLSHGIDVVLHSATKYLGGHSDLTAGAICGTEKFIAQAWRTMILLGSSLASLDAWLLLRGLRTLSMRVECSNKSALALAKFLAAHPKVAQVYYPGLETHPQHALAKKQMCGFGGTMSVEMNGGYEAAQSVIRNVKYFTNAVSLGGVESLITHPAGMWSLHYTAEQRKATGISAGLLRLSVGIESEKDLISDFEDALKSVN
jgi:cystathionine beta-lyase